jgi:hypothetical protein
VNEIRRASPRRAAPAVALRYDGRLDLRAAGEAFTRAGLPLALELALEPERELDESAAVLGVSAALDELGLDTPSNRLAAPAAPDGVARPDDAVSRSMARLRALRARRLVVRLPELGRPAAARSLGSRLDGVAARLQGHGFALGLEVPRGGAVGGALPSLVALITRSTIPSFFLALDASDLPAFLADGWGRALAPWVRQVSWRCAGGAGGARADAERELRDTQSARADSGEAPGSEASAVAALAALPELDGVVLVPQPATRNHDAPLGEALTTALAAALASLTPCLELASEVVEKKIAGNRVGGLSLGVALP